MDLNCDGNCRIAMMSIHYTAITPINSRVSTNSEQEHSDTHLRNLRLGT